jgi:hypothetical protein
MVAGNIPKNGYFKTKKGYLFDNPLLGNNPKVLF